MAIRVLLAVVLSTLVAAPAASAQPDGQGSDRFVTFVARECPAYTDITANRARNDIQESLKDLGADTAYRAGEPIDPAVEASNQPDCAPITGWDFTLGTGIKTRAVSGPWGSLSIVTGAYPTAIRTQAQAPLLDYAGRPTGRTLDGAVTIELTEAQAERAARSSSLWTEGGTPTDPILNALYPGEFGFGALRCSVDNLNGDNVEWISYPSGSEHVFCYAYYVKPPPTSGTIVIRKEVRGVSSASEPFTFDGNLSFNADSRFTLNVQNGNPASQTFYRAAGAPAWTARELVPDGWDLVDLSCQQTGASQVTTSLTEARVSILLAAGDRVTCTFTDQPRPRDGQLFLRKLSRGATGLFEFDVLPLGGGDRSTAAARTVDEGEPVDAEPSPLELAPGRYRIEERRAQRRGGRWRLERVACNGRDVPVEDRGVEVGIEEDRGVTCTFENEFVPAGAITLDKATLGGVGTTGFVVAPVGDRSRVYFQTASTRSQGVPVRARGDGTSRLRLGEYVIQEIEPEAADGDWELSHVVCDGRLVPFAQGRLTVRLTRENPRLRCAFLDRFTPGAGPGPEPPGPNPRPGAPKPDLVLTKRADRPAAGVGERISYSVTVLNRGPVAAEDVVLADRAGSGQRLLSVRAGGRSCRPGRLIVCRLGPLAPGASITLRFEMLITTDAPGIVRNVAVVGSASSDARVRNNGAVAAVRARRLVCAAALGRLRPPAARAAC